MRLLSLGINLERRADRVIFVSGLTFNTNRKIIFAMHIQDKTKEELIIELEELHKAYDSLKVAKKADQPGCELTEEALLKSRELLKTIEQAAKIGGWEFDVETMVQTWTEEIFNILEIDTTHGAPDVPEGIGFIAPEYQPMALLGIQRAIEFGEPYNQEWEVITAKGNKRWINAIARPYRENGKTKFVSGSFQDITKRKLAEIALLTSEENLSTTLLSIGDGVISTDKNGVIIQMNPVAETLCGWQLTEASGLPLADVFRIINSETRIPIADPVKKVLEKGEIAGLANHTVLVSRNGTEYQIADSAAPIMNKDGEITGVVLVFSDVTEKYAAQKQIKESEERYRSLLNNLEAGIVVHAPDTSIVMNNARASELLGLSSDQMRGKAAIDPAWKFTHEDNTALTLDEYPVNRIVNGRQSIINQVLGIHRPGENEVVWVTVNGFPVLDTNGEITEVVISFVDITQRKLTEEALKNREILLNKIFDLLPIGLWYADENGKLIRGNPAGVRIWGAEPTVSIEEYGVFKARRYPSGGEIEPDDWALAHTIREGITIIDEQLEIEAFDGQNKIILNYTAPVLDDQGNTLGAIVVNQDITQQKRLEEVHTFLSTSGYPGSNATFFESLAKYLSETLDSEYVCIDKLEGDGLTAQTVAIYNEGIFDPNVSYSLKQTPCGEVVGKTICCFPENVCQLFPHDEALQTLNAHSYIGTTLWSFDGKPIGLIAIIGQKPLKNAAFAENVLKLVAIRAAGELERIQAEDGLKSAKEKAEANEEKYRLSEMDMLEAQRLAHIGSWLWDLKTGLVTWSKELYNINGHNPDIPVPLFADMASFYTDDSWKAINEAVAKTFNTGEPYSLDFEMVKPDGTIFFTNTRGSANYNEAGGMINLHGTVQDISERKKIENEIRLLNETLENRIAERTSQLETLNKELTFHLSELEQFSYVSNHDLQEPLRTLSQFTLLFNEKYAGKLDEEGNRYLDFISKSAVRMSTLVRDLLEYSLLGKESVKTLVDCNRIVDAVLSDLDDSIKADNTKITVQELPVFTGYETEMRQLFQNLIGNAIKYQKPGNCPEIHISAENHDKEWIFSIRDNGIGIEQKYFEKIFIIFQRLHNRNEYDGTGIGLANCRKVVGLHGGKIWVESTPGEGSNFMFTIPRQ